MKSPGANQLPLFEFIPSRENQLEKTTWSYSRRSLLAQCPRKYYYEYYGANKLTAVNEPQKEQLRFLKTLQNRYERTGALLHFIIRHYFKKAQQGEQSPFERLQAWAEQLYQNDIRRSETDPSGNQDYGEEYPPVLLHEFHYQWPEAKQVCVEAGTRMLEGLHTFFHDKTFSHFRYYGSQSGALVEQSIKIPNVPCKVDGKVDLAYIFNGQVNVIDWKSGNFDGAGDESLQLAAYALWAKSNFDASTDQLRVFKVFLGSGDVVEFPINEALLDSARVRIIQDAETMIELSRYGETGNVEAFTPCEHVGVCALCSYRRACPEGEN